MDWGPLSQGPAPWTTGLGVRVVDSFRSNFDCCRQLQKQTLLSPSTYGCCADFVAIGLLKANGCFSSLGVTPCPEWPARQQLFRAPIV